MYIFQEMIYEWRISTIKDAPYHQLSREYKSKPPYTHWNKGEIGTLTHCWWECRKCSHLENSLAFTQMLNIELSCGGSSDLATKLCQTLVTSWTMVHQASLSMGSRQEYWSGCHFLLQEIFPTQGLNPGLLHCRQSPALQVDSLPTEPPGKPRIII